MSRLQQVKGGTFFETQCLSNATTGLKPASLHLSTTGTAVKTSMVTGSATGRCVVASL